jgi:hypothetical protein
MTAGSLAAYDMCRCVCEASSTAACPHYAGECDCPCPVSRTTECACECEHTWIYTSWQDAVSHAAGLARVNGSDPVAYFLSALEDEPGVRLMGDGLKKLRAEYDRRAA